MPAMTPQLDDLVVLLVDLSEFNLCCGDFGRVCGYHTAPAPMYEVEFQMALNGHVVHALLTSEQIQVVPPQEMDALGEAYLSIRCGSQRRVLGHPQCKGELYNIDVQMVMGGRCSR